MKYKYVVLRKLTHNCVDFPVGAILEFNSHDNTAKRLIEKKIITRIDDEDVKNPPESTPTLAFNAPSSTAEIEKQVIKSREIDGKLAAWCVQCKQMREIADPTVVIEAQQKCIRGKCPVCNTTLLRMAGKAKIEEPPVGSEKPKKPEAADGTS